MKINTHIQKQPTKLKVEKEKAQALRRRRFLILLKWNERES